MTGAAVEVTPAVLARHPLPAPDGSAGKGGRGDVVVVGGTPETPGALALAGAGALRIGAGRIQLVAGRATAAALAVAVPEARVVAVDDADEEAYDRAVADRLDELVDGADAVLVGPGTFGAASARRTLAAAGAVLADGDAVLVVDAGALAALGEAPDAVAGLGAWAVAMPNPGEAARLLGDEGADDPERALALAVARLGATVTVRGDETWTAGPGTAVHVDRSGAVGLATCGSGDVLAGLVAGAAARGASPLAAVLWATAAHAGAGRRAAERYGPVGFLARDLLPEVGGAVAALGG